MSSCHVLGDKNPHLSNLRLEYLVIGDSRSLNGSPVDLTVTGPRFRTIASCEPQVIMRGRVADASNK